MSSFDQQQQQQQQQQHHPPSSSHHVNSNNSSSSSSSSSTSTGLWNAFSQWRPSSSHLAAMTSDLSAYVSSSVGSFAHQSSEVLRAATMQPRRRCVLTKSMCSWYYTQKRYRFLLIGLIDGFQIIEIESTKQMRILHAHTDAPVHTPTSLYANGSTIDEASILNQAAAASTPIGIMAMITHPYAFVKTPPPPPSSAPSSSSSLTSPPSSSIPTSSSSIYYGSLVAICSLDDRAHFPRSMLKIYSLPLQRYVHLIRLRSRIFGVHTHPTNRYMIITLENELHVYTTPSDPYSLHFECIWSTRILPNPSPHILAALQTSLNTHRDVSSSTTSLLATSTFCKDEWSVCAVSHRWVAYCLNEPLQPSIEVASIYADDNIEHHQPTLPTSSSNDSLSTVAKGIASGLYNLGGMGKLAVANYLSGDQESAILPKVHASASILGTVLVRDIQTQRIIACIRAHPNTQITHIAFDRSGTLLATVSQDGQYCHIYQICMIPEPISMSQVAQGQQANGTSSTDHSPQHGAQPRRSSLSSHSPASHITSPPQPHQPVPPQPRYHTRFLYRLFRGITHASIRDISFSFDSKFVSLVSTKGTTHIYAIHPVLGGDVSIHTHGPSQYMDDGALIQQMVSKYAILKQQQQQAAASSSSSSTMDYDADHTAQSALDSFMYQPKILSAIHRLKPSGVPTAFMTGQVQYHTPMYMPVIAAFDRLETVHSTNDEVSTPHHLLICSWNEELNSYSLTTTCASHANTNSDDVAPSEKRPKLLIQLDPLASFDLHPGLVHNGMNTQPQHAVGGANGVSLKQPHQQQSHDGIEEQPTVRILTQRGQEDDSALQPHQLTSTNLRANVISPQAPALQSPYSFFQQLESDLLAGRAPSPPSAAPTTVQRSNAIAQSTIFSALSSSRPSSTNNSPSLNSTPHVSQQTQQQQLASRWLSAVELRTYQSSDVALWARPQFSLKAYDTQGPLGLFTPTQTKPLAYDKFHKFAGLRTEVDKPDGNHSGRTSANMSKSSSASGAEFEAALSAALSSNMLDDAGFVASLRASDRHSVSEAGEVEFDSDRDERNGHYLTNGTSAAGRGSVDQGQHSQVFGMSVDEDYITRAGRNSSTAPVVPSSSPGMTFESPTPSPPSAAISSSTLFTNPAGASASQILMAPLPSVHHHHALEQNGNGANGTAGETADDLTMVTTSVSPPIEEILSGGGSAGGGSGSGSTNAKKKKKNKK